MCFSSGLEGVNKWFVCHVYVYVKSGSVAFLCVIVCEILKKLGLLTQTSSLSNRNARKLGFFL